MNAEQLEAWCLERVQNRRLFAALGQGDYLLSEDELLSLIRIAWKAGRVCGAGDMTRLFQEGMGEIAASVQVRVTE